MLRTLTSILLAAALGLTQAQAFAQDVARSALPPAAHDTLQLITKGGPFPHKRDGITFGNFEKRLPQRSRGHYREYTVTTPGLSHRGAKRIVCGGEDKRRPEACYYTADHYRSFRKIQQ